MPSLNFAMRGLSAWILLGRSLAEAAQVSLLRRSWQDIYLSGDCNGSSDHNGYWHSQGPTASGRLFYKHAEKDGCKTCLETSL